MFVHHRTSGFILKKVDRREAGQLLMIYTKDFGKLEILAKAVRKISSKLRSGAEIFYLSEIEFIQGKTNKTLTDAILIEKFENLRKDLKKIKIAHKIVEVFDILIQGQEKDENLWSLLNETFDKLNNQQLTINNQQLPEPQRRAKRTSFSSLPHLKLRWVKKRIYPLCLLYYYFFWNLLSILGYRPELYSCVLCQKKLVPGKFFFSAKEGGVICQKCFKELKLGSQRTSVLFHPALRSGKEITTETIKILRIILKKDWTLFSKLKIEKPNLKSLNTIINEYYSYTESRLRDESKR